METSGVEPESEKNQKQRDIQEIGTFTAEVPATLTKVRESIYQLKALATEIYIVIEITKYLSIFLKIENG